MRSTALLLCLCVGSSLVRAEERIALERDDAKGQLTVLIDGDAKFAYQYADSLDTPHLWPLRSPSGKLLTAEYPPRKLYPHHRSVWIVDRVQLEGQPDVDFYHSWKNQAKPHDPKSPFRHRIKHVEFTRTEVVDGLALVGMKQVWQVNRKTPVLDETCDLVVQPLAESEYLIDLSFKLTASYGNVRFLSDPIHYAWPYVRMHPQFSGDQGGTLVDDAGHTGDEEINKHYARWVDYSNSVDGVTEGLTIFTLPKPRHKWLTRAYGAWGPRRADKYSGTKFTLKCGKSIGGRVGLYVHRGDAQTGHVAQRYQDYLKMVAEP